MKPIENFATPIVFYWATCLTSIAAKEVSAEDLTEIDRWALARMARVAQRAQEAYQSFEFHVVFQVLYNFCVIDLSSFYFDVLKDRLYTSAPGSLDRRAAQTALFRISDTLVRLLAPILLSLAKRSGRSFICRMNLLNRYTWLSSREKSISFETTSCWIDGNDFWSFGPVSARRWRKVGRKSRLVIRWRRRFKSSVVPKLLSIYRVFLKIFASCLLFLTSS